MTVESAKKEALVPTRQSFSEMERIDRTVETSMTAAAAESRAMVEARYVMAVKNPRNWDTVRQNLLKECSRPTFANDPSAFYHKPIGKGVEGLGIRFAEVAIRCMTNVLAESFTVSEDDSKRVIKVLILDLESNTSHSKTITVSKTVERSKPMDDGSYISVRQNSAGYPVYTVPATDDDLLNKEAALISKALRTNTLRLVPGDLQDECEKEIKRIRTAKIKEDPDAAKKNIIDSFAKFNVSVANLEEYLDHSLDQVTPAELLNLQALYGALRDEEITSWKAVMDNVEEMRKLTRKPKPGADEKGVEAAKEKIKEQAPATTTPPATAAKSATTEKEKKAETKPAATKKSNKTVEKEKVAPSSTEQEPVVGPETPPVEQEEESGGLVSDEEPVVEMVDEETVSPAEVAGEEEEVEETIDLRGILFPKDLDRRTYKSEEDKFTQEQWDEASKECARVKAKLPESIKNVLKIDAETINKRTMGLFIDFLKTINPAK